MLSSLAGNNYPTITYLKENLWQQAFQDSLLDPEFLLAAGAYFEVVDDLINKQLAGFPPTLTDVWGRLLSFQLLEGSEGGVSTTLSSITRMSNFTSYAVPYPIITSLGVKTWLGQCLPGPNATIYEFSPYEFGSWDSDVSAFTLSHYLGTSLKNGRPTGLLCTENFDNLGYVLGTSSTLFNEELCLSLPSVENSTTNIVSTIAQILDYAAHQITTSDQYANYPNPFYEYVSSTSIPNSANDVPAQVNLSLVDGGEALQNNPIFPLLQPDRQIDAIIVNDNSADTATNFPNGSEILTTYVQSFNQNLTRMPFIPPVATFISEGLNKRATFFGCHDTTKVTIVYLPNAAFTFASNVSSETPEYSEADTDAMIANGVEVATQGGDAGWATCLGCALMMNTGQALPSDCTACYAKYCYNGS